MAVTDQATIEWTHIADLIPTSKGINIRFRVIDVKQPRHIFSKTTSRESQLIECIVGDSTGIINLTLWNDDIDLLELHCTFELRNGHINIYDECMTLTKGRAGVIQKCEIKIEVVNQNTDMSRPFMGKPKRKQKPRSPTGRTFDGSAGREIRKFCGRKSF